MRWSSILALGVWLPAAAQAQNTDVAELREGIHEQLKTGHVPLAYSDTDEAMEGIYADPAIPGNLILFYANRSQDADEWVSGDPQDGWNREHLWPQSRGVRPSPMKSDLHALRPSDASVNQSRGNLNFDNGGSPQGEAPSTFLDGDSFEPRDGIKGDVARAMFYMDVRYEGTGGEPDLDLVDATPPKGGVVLGDLCTLLAWHNQDPVDAAELAINDAIENVQGNRNVFVDNPDLANAVYDAECGAVAPLLKSAATGAGKLTIASWNIANLGSPGATLRGFERDGDDYLRLEEIIADFDADVIAFQEIGSIAALEAVLPPGYSFQFETRCLTNDVACASDQDDIYNAIAVRSDLGHSFFQIDELAI